jgi:hypothetical protein
MNNASIRNTILASIVLIIIYVSLPSISSSFFSYFLVILFVVVTFRLTWDGIKRKQKFESEVDVLETNIKSEIDTFYEKNLDNKARINRLTVIENSCANNDKFKKWEKEKRYYQSLPNFLLSIG